MKNIAITIGCIVLAVLLLVSAGYAIQYHTLAMAETSRANQAESRADSLQTALDKARQPAPVVQVEINTGTQKGPRPRKGGKQ